MFGKKKKKPFSRQEISKRAAYRKKKEGLKQLNVWIPKDLIEKLKDKSEMEEETMRDLVVMALKNSW